MKAMNEPIYAQIPATLRQAGRNDAAKISQLIYRSCRPKLLETFSLPARQAFLSQIHPDALLLRLNQDCCYWLLEQEGEPLATLGLQQGFHLRHLFVAPQWQGRGLASQLWRSVRPLRQPRYFSIYAQPEAVPIYYHWGFRPLGKTVLRAHMPVVPMLLFTAKDEPS